MAGVTSLGSSLQGGLAAFRQAPLRRLRPTWHAAAWPLHWHPVRHSARGARALRVSATTDYAATRTDAPVLQLPNKQELQAHEMTHVFGYPRDLRQHYAIGGVLGAGSFGIVREATDVRNHRLYACKTIPKIPKRGKGTPRYLLKIQAEVDAMQQIGGSLDAVFLKDVFEDDAAVHLVMELCTGGGILERVQSGFTERRIATIIRSILRFIGQCHAKGIIYRDVKPDNFLFLHKGQDSPVRATDFGLSIRWWPGEPKLRSRSGTPVYMAPEVILQEYDQQADVWSVGILLYQMLTGRFPFWDSIHNLSLQTVWQAILMKPVDYKSHELRDVSAPAKQLLQGLLERDPELRMTPAAALEHPWLADESVPQTQPLRGSVMQRLQRFATYGLLKQTVLKMITDEVEKEVDSTMARMLCVLRELFSQLDTDASGGIDERELVAGLAAAGYAVSGAEVERLMARIDFNRDGTIDSSEFATSLLDWREVQQDELWLRWVDLAFSRLDLNGDGFISLDELVQRLPLPAAPAAINGNGNGNGALARSQPDERLLLARRMLREADVNGDGRISRDEFHQLLSQSTVPDSLDQYDARLLAVRT